MDEWHVDFEPFVCRTDAGTAGIHADGSLSKACGILDHIVDLLRKFAPCSAELRVQPIHIPANLPRLRWNLALHIAIVTGASISDAVGIKNEALNETKTSSLRFCR